MGTEDVQEVLHFTSITFDTDEDTYCWSITASVADLETWIKCEVGKVIYITINEDIFSFEIDSRERSESFDTQSYSFTGRSVTSQYGTGSAAIYKTWEATTAHTIINELIDEPNIQILDWAIPSDVFESEGSTPIELVTQIATAAGAILYTDVSGTLNIVYKYKQAPSNYVVSSTDHVLTDTDHIFELREYTEVTDKYNAVEVMNEEISDEGSVSISEYSISAIDKTTVLRIDIFPFVTSIELFTSQNDVTIADTTVETEEITETIEVVDGSATTSDLVYNTESYEYLDNNLGELTISGTDILTEITGNSLISITYTTQYLLCSVSSITSDTVQIYMEE